MLFFFNFLFDYCVPCIFSFSFFRNSFFSSFLNVFFLSASSRALLQKYQFVLQDFAQFMLFPKENCLLYGPQIQRLMKAFQMAAVKPMIPAFHLTTLPPLSQVSNLDNLRHFIYRMDTQCHTLFTKASNNYLHHATTIQLLFCILFFSILYFQHLQYLLSTSYHILFN